MKAAITDQRYPGRGGADLADRRLRRRFMTVVRHQQLETEVRAGRQIERAIVRVHEGEGERQPDAVVRRALTRDALVAEAIAVGLARRTSEGVHAGRRQGAE